jgi:hypothetical protein
MNVLLAPAAALGLAFLASRQARHDGSNSPSLNSDSGQASPTLGFSNPRSEASSISQSTIPA